MPTRFDDVARTWLQDAMKYTHALTVAYAYEQIGEVNLQSVRRHLRLLHAFVDGKLFGKRFNKIPLSRRTQYVAFPTAISNWRNPHIHMAWFVPETEFSIFENLFRANTSLWQKLVPAGTHQLEVIYDASNWIGYCKAQCPTDQIIFSSELVPEIAHS